MYEIWLMMNIVFEIALDYWMLVVSCLAIWLVLMFLARAKLNRQALKPAIQLGAVSAVFAFLALPGINQSSLADMVYWVDWFNLASWSLTAGVMAVFVAYPLISLMKK